MSNHSNRLRLHAWREKRKTGPHEGLPPPSVADLQKGVPREMVAILEEEAIFRPGSKEDRSIRRRILLRDYMATTGFSFDLLRKEPDEEGAEPGYHNDFFREWHADMTAIFKRLEKDRWSVEHFPKKEWRRYAALLGWIMLYDGNQENLTIGLIADIDAGPLNADEVQAEWRHADAAGVTRSLGQII